jgi:hypothetical protein
MGPRVGERNRVARCEVRRTGRAINRGRSSGYAQSEHLWSVACLDVVPLALPGIARDDGEVFACDGEDRSPVFRVWVELPLLGHRAIDA